MKRNNKFILLICLLFIFLSFTKVVAAVNKEAMTCMDYPYSNLATSNNIDISGWAVNNSGVKLINIFLEMKMKDKL